MSVALSDCHRESRNIFITSLHYTLYLLGQIDRSLSGLDTRALPSPASPETLERNFNNCEIGRREAVSSKAIDQKI